MQKTHFGFICFRQKTKKFIRDLQKALFNSELHFKEQSELCVVVKKEMWMVHPVYKAAHAMQRQMWSFFLQYDFNLCILWECLVSWRKAIFQRCYWNWNEFTCSLLCWTPELNDSNTVCSDAVLGSDLTVLSVRGWKCKCVRKSSLADTLAVRLCCWPWCWSADIMQSN